MSDPAERLRSRLWFGGPVLGKQDTDDLDQALTAAYQRGKAEGYEEGLRQERERIRAAAIAASETLFTPDGGGYDLGDGYVAIPIKKLSAILDAGAEGERTP